MIFRRTLLLLVFALFWGGLTSYTGFILRVSHYVLNDEMTGGLITQQVTRVLQILGVVALIPMTLNAVQIFRKSRPHGYGLLACSALLAIALVGLFVVHGQMDATIDIENADIIDREAFTIGHRRYNQLTTVEWLATLAYLPITLSAWRVIDGKGS